MSEQQRAMVPASGDAVLNIIASAARDPQVDVEKMAQLLALQERIMDRRAEMEFTEAMNRVQAEIPPIRKTRKIIVKGTLRSKYAALEDIDAILRPLTIREGFSLLYSTEDVPPKSTKLVLTVKHRAGHKQDFSLVLPIEKTEFRSSAQDVAATVSFGKRMLRCMAFDVVTVDEDWDGNPPSEFVTTDQAIHITDLLKDTGLRGDDQRFLAWAGADSIEHISKSAYSRVVNELKRRVAK